jgi:hypothetical protein
VGRLSRRSCLQQGRSRSPAERRLPTVNWSCGPGNDSTSTRCSYEWSTPQLLCGGASRRPNQRRSSRSMYSRSAVSPVDRPPPAPGIARRAVGSSTATVSGHQRSRRGPRVGERLQDHRCRGPVVKGASTRYQPARRDWVKVNSIAIPSVWARASGALGLVRHKVIGGLRGNAG